MHWTRLFALASGVIGVAAGVCFVLLYALAHPWTGVQNSWAWTGPANDWLGALSYLALGPVVFALRGRLPPSRTLTVASIAVAAVALVSPVVLLFEVNLVVGAITVYVIFIWILTASLLGHRTRSLPRVVTRAGLLIGGALPIGVLLILPGLVTPAPARWFLIGPGVAIGVIAYLCIPLFPLLLARFVFL